MSKSAYRSLSFTNMREACEVYRAATICRECGKRSFRNEADARLYIGLLLRKAPKSGKGSWAIHPYRCPHEHGWHVGRNHEVLMVSFRNPDWMTTKRFNEL